MDECKDLRTDKAKADKESYNVVDKKICCGVRYARESWYRRKHDAFNFLKEMKTMITKILYTKFGTTIIIQCLLGSEKEPVGAIHFSNAFRRHKNCYSTTL